MSLFARGMPLALSALFLLSVSAPLWAQSLADVARAEEERRRAIKTPARVYTNKDLVTLPPVVGPAEKPPTASAPAEGPPASDASTKEATDSGPAKDQKYWSGRMKALKSRLESDETFAAALQSQINGLTTDFAARDDPAQRAVLAKNRQKALADLDRLKQAVTADKKAITDLEDEARKAGVPPGWLRS